MRRYCPSFLVYSIYLIHSFFVVVRRLTLFYQYSFNILSVLLYTDIFIYRVPPPPFFFFGVAAVDADPAGTGCGDAGTGRAGRPGRLVFTTTGAAAATAATAGVPGLSLFIYPCVISCPVSFCLFAVYVRFLLILLLVKSLFNEEADILPREPLNELGKFLSCPYKCMPLLGMIRS